MAESFWEAARGGLPEIPEPLGFDSQKGREGLPMKRTKIWLLALALLALLYGAARAEMFVEGYIGGNWTANAPDDFTWEGLIRPSYPGHIDPAFQGGLKLGAWFERSGVLSGLNFPTWMRYFGFWLDFSYHALNFPARTYLSNSDKIPNGTFSSEGAVATLAFMFGARYGFFPDAEVPFGRLQPYVAVGPALMFSWQQPTINILATQYHWDADSSSSTNVGLAVEAGLRWMALKNVSLEVSFKYRYFNPTYKYQGPLGIGPDPNCYLRPNFHLFSLQVGAAYHF
jgi:opacity protein-like surface antigen